MNAIYFSLVLSAVLATAQASNKSTARVAPCCGVGVTPARLIAALTARRDALLERRHRLTQLQQLARAGGQETTTVVEGLDGTPYAVTHAPSATIGELWPLLEAGHNLAQADYTLHGMPREVDEDPDAGAPLGQGARAADYDQLAIVARMTPLTTTFGTPHGNIYCDGRTAKTYLEYDTHGNCVVRAGLEASYVQSGLATQDTALGPQFRPQYSGRARLGRWADPRSGRLRVRLQMETGACESPTIGLVRKGIWNYQRLPDVKGWDYYIDTSALVELRDGAFFGNGGVLEVELRDGALHCRVDGADQEDAVFQIPQGRGRVGLAVGFKYCGEVTLLDH